MKTDPYNLMLIVINNNTQTKNQLLKKADVYYANERLNDEEYKNIIAEINKKFSVDNE